MKFNHGFVKSQMYKYLKKNKGEQSLLNNFDVIAYTMNTSYAYGYELNPFD